MNNVTTLLQNFIEDESGLTAVEYAIAGSLVVGGLVVSFTELGTATESSIQNLCTAANASATCDGSSATTTTTNP
ncbi:Flp family type IVb pilin [Alteromonas sp. ASW11-19]|uniref:Flp family type IVb pilin n=1 Tax=Alteromonas salexigens TaxID=2982530 RepID=A0ABT2VSM5_9ALTE|nr:Flp family type IVb pilin [Alteromonas salexigens]MCU7554879.1 Flp family type IVb pilin [Alteromonas salexigens]